MPTQPRSTPSGKNARNGSLRHGTMREPSAEHRPRRLTGAVVTRYAHDHGMPLHSSALRTVSTPQTPSPALQAPKVVCTLEGGWVRTAQHAEPALRLREGFVLVFLEPARERLPNYREPLRAVP